jgi:hypothetical protein
MSTTDRLVADLACLDPVYVDGIILEGVANLGPNFTTPFFRWVPTINSNGVMVMERSPALLLVRPRGRCCHARPWRLCSIGNPHRS